jgi:probable F420-dependent oxidoreductase
VVARGGVPDRATWLDRVRRWDAQGFDLLMTPDHLGMWPPLLPLVAAAEASDRLRFGTHVLNAAFCNPALLARDAAAADVLTDGRMELGFGAGYAEREFVAAGIPYPTVGERVRWLERLLVSLRPLLTEAAVGFPVAQSHLPFMVGGNGDRVLAIGARHADAVHLLGLTSGTTTVDPTPTHFGWDGLADRIDHVHRHAGDRPVEIRVMLQDVQITDGTPSFARAERLGLRPAQVLDSPFCLVGPRSAATEHLGRLAAAGVSMVTVLEEHADGLAGLRGTLDG